MMKIFQAEDFSENAKKRLDEATKKLELAQQQGDEAAISHAM